MSDPEIARPTTTQTRNVQLAEAKDRAQSTATIAMSVVHVAYLRALIVAGPDANRFYTLVLWLVIVSLVLQVAAGLLALAITQMKSYYQTHHDDMCADIRAMCCYCCCPPRPPTKSCDVTDREAQHSEPGETASCEARQSPTGCFTKCVGHSPISEYERSIYLHTEAIRKQIVTVEQEGIEAECNMAAASNAIADCRSKLETLRKEKGTMDESDYKEKLKKLTDEETMAESRLARYKRTTDKLEVAKRKSKALKERMDNILQEDILKRVTFWQSALNYVLYVIIVSNIFITGLGWGGTVEESGVGTGTRGVANNVSVVSDAK